MRSRLRGLLGETPLSVASRAAHCLWGAWILTSDPQSGLFDPRAGSYQGHRVLSGPPADWVDGSLPPPPLPHTHTHTHTHNLMMSVSTRPTNTHSTRHKLTHTFCPSARLSSRPTHKHRNTPSPNVCRPDTQTHRHTDTQY